MLVSGAPGVQEQCLVAARGVATVPCTDAIVSGKGAEIFASKLLSEQCLQVTSGNILAVDCQDSQGAWDMTQEGQMKQGNTCLAVTGSQVKAADCDDVASVGGDKFFQAAVPEHHPGAVTAVQEAGLRASVQRQRATVSAMQQLMPKPETRKTASLAVNASALRPVLVHVREGAGSRNAAEALPTVPRLLKALARVWENLRPCWPAWLKFSRQFQPS